MANKKATPALASLAAKRKKRKPAARRNPAAAPAARAMTANPPALADLTHVVLPGFGAYAASRILQRVAFTVVGRRFPRLAKHTHAITGVAAFGAAWMLAHRWAKLAKYHDGILVGTGVAALHGVAQAYLPSKYNWLLADCNPATLPANAKALGKASMKRQFAAQGKPKPTAGDEFSYLEDQLDQIDDAPYPTIKPPRASRNPVAAAMKVADINDNDDTAVFDGDLSDLLEPGEGVDDLYSGAFEQN